MRDVNYAQTYLELGNRRLKRRLYIKAVRAYKMAILYDNANSLAHTNLGLTYWKMGSLEDALLEMEEASTLNPMSMRISNYVEVLSEELFLKSPASKGNVAKEGFMERIKSFLFH